MRRAAVLFPRSWEKLRTSDQMPRTAASEHAWRQARAGNTSGRTPVKVPRQITSAYDWKEANLQGNATEPAGSLSTATALTCRRAMRMTVDGGHLPSESSLISHATETMLATCVNSRRLPGNTNTAMETGWTAAQIGFGILPTF